MASGGRLKSNHLVQLQRIKAVVTKGLGEGAAHRSTCSSRQRLLLCILHVSQMYASCIEQLKLVKSLTSGLLLHRLWENIFEKTVRLFSCTVTRIMHQHSRNAVNRV